MLSWIITRGKANINVNKANIEVRKKCIKNPI